MTETKGFHHKQMTERPSFCVTAGFTLPFQKGGYVLPKAPAALDQS